MKLYDYHYQGDKKIGAQKRPVTEEAKNSSEDCMNKDHLNSGEGQEMALERRRRGR